ncbi:plasmid mobilization relaxosome protein MobC [Variovorax saccharolyticus]|uniref:plasmid mobilization relaxosome protein MobC n=1 Tax=Variovorax saccharolyticus TaxID=3053516 RepID=UPI0025775E56|nr:plasmid mobilization relaxosome protein MobC [Variovorax sp. J31P216]MDM0029142.1 plasmid mobilization relaxosome protein MobC [Variovorax sp. J31P216]
MSRDILKVDGVSPDTKTRLQQSAERLYGQPNASQLVRALIASHLTRSTAPLNPVDLSGETVRVELRLPKAVVSALDERAEDLFSTRNFYINQLIFADLGHPQFHPREIETLCRSNYEISKIGSNLNQIAKAFNTLVKTGSGEMPEIGKKMASLRKEIVEHTRKVLRVLEVKTAAWELRGRGQKVKQKKR